MVFLLISASTFVLPAAVIVNVVAILLNSVCLYVLVSHVNRERVGLDAGYVKKALDEFSTGLTRHGPFNIFALLTWNLQTSFRILIIFSCFSIYPCAEQYFTWNPVWRLPAELPRIHATTALLHKNLDGYGVHTSGNFLFQMFERLGVQIFLRLACFRANETPKRTNLSFISIL